MRRLGVAAAFIVLFFASSQAHATGTEWLPRSLRARLEKISQSASSRPRADLFFCNPYCELIGEFYSREDFRARAAPDIPSTLAEAKKIKNSKYLRLVLIPPRPERKAKAEKKVETEKPQTAGPIEIADEQLQPLLVGGHLDALFGATALTTASNTDTASDSQLHPVFSGGLDFEAQNLLTIGSGKLGAIFDLSYWGALGPKSKISTGQSWSSQSFRALLGAFWQKNRSPWRFGLLIEGRQESDDPSSNTAVSFSSTYDWVSLGVHVNYRKTTLRLLHSLVGLVQDAGQYRGTQVDSSKTMLEFTSCKTLAGILRGQFDLCADAQLSMSNVTGTGTPLQPVFTANPSYDYTGWQAGLQFRISGISL